MQETDFYVDKSSRNENSGSRSRPVQLVTAILPIVIIGIVVGSLFGLQWAGQRSIQLGYQQPHVRIGALSIATLLRNKDYQFSATGYGRELSYFWDFGDQSTDTGTNVHHIYQTNGTFIVTVTVTDPANHRATQSEKITVVPPAPQASFTYTYNYGYVSFDASNSSADSSTSIVSYTWNFGDGSAPDILAYAQDSHFYSNTEPHQVTLTVTDATGQVSRPFTLTVSNASTPTATSTPVPTATSTPAPNAIPYPSQSDAEADIKYYYANESDFKGKNVIQNFSSLTYNAQTGPTDQPQFLACAVYTFALVSSPNVTTDTARHTFTFQYSNSTWSVIDIGNWNSC